MKIRHYKRALHRGPLRALLALRRVEAFAQKIIDGLPLVGKLFILDESGEVRPAQTFDEWGRAMDGNRHVGDEMVGDCRVSTVFLGMNQSPPWHQGEPLVFETMFFKPDECGIVARYSTIEEAREGHARTVAMVKAELAA